MDAAASRRALDAHPPRSQRTERVNGADLPTDGIGFDRGHADQRVAVHAPSGRIITASCRSYQLAPSPNWLRARPRFCAAALHAAARPGHEPSRSAGNCIIPTAVGIYSRDPSPWGGRATAGAACTHLAACAALEGRRRQVAYRRLGSQQCRTRTSPSSVAFHPSRLAFARTSGWRSKASAVGVTSRVLPPERHDRAIQAW